LVVIKIETLPDSKVRQILDSYLSALSRFTSSMIAGTTSKISPTIPKSAISKIGASGSLFTATIMSEELIPAQ